MRGSSRSKVVGRICAALVAVALAGAPVALAGPAAAAETDSDERILGYQVELVLATNGSMAVTERIDYDFGGNARHGVIRDIDNRQRYDGDHDRIFPIEGVRASTPAGPAPVEVTESGGEVHVRIGDPNVTVTGVQSYTISYTVRAATTRLPDHDELYWNAIGPGWTVPVANAQVTVRAPDTIRDLTCYAGPAGARSPCAGATADGATASYRQGQLAAGEALTVVASLVPDTVATAAPVLVQRRTPRWYLARQPWPVGVGVVMIIGGAVLLLVRRVRRARAERAALAASVAPLRRPETSPPDGIPPGLAGLLVAASPQRAQAVATLADLAGRGYLSIEPAGTKDWRMRVLRAPDAGLRPWESTLLSGLFARSPDVLLSSLRSRLGPTLQRVLRQLGDEAVRVGWHRSGSGGRHAYGAVGCAAFVLGIPFAIGLGLAFGAGAVGMAISVAGILLFAAALVGPPVETPAGAAMRARVIGFQHWLRGTNPDTLPPDEQEAALRWMMPYAVAFGFAPLLVGAFAPVLAGAGWYASQAYYHDFTTFSSDVTRTASSSSSGFSSSGSSGGGGGGGGGSSW